MAHPVDKHVGEMIRQRRWLKGMTQQELAMAVGIRFQQIQKYETGVNRVSASRLWDLATALSVPVAYFFDGYEGEPCERQDPGAMPERETLSLLRSLQAIPPMQRRKLVDLARSLSSDGRD